METILKKCLKLLKALARGNDLVQMRIFERLDSLLKIKVVEVDMAVALREASRPMLWLVFDCYLYDELHEICVILKI